MNRGYLLEDYDYSLPDDRIALYPARNRSGSRLMILDRNRDRPVHAIFSDLIDWLNPGDCLVLNKSKVFPARLRGRKPTGGRVELFLLEFPTPLEEGVAVAPVLYRSSKPIRIGQVIHCGENLELQVLSTDNGTARVRLHFEGELEAILSTYGEVPLPPYIKRAQDSEDRLRYQTVYAKDLGSVAAPTAGLHFTREVLERIARKGIHMAWITLHVGYGTFAPVRSHDIRQHKIHSEWIEVGQAAVDRISTAKAYGQRVVAVGTTSVRAVEFVAQHLGQLKPFKGQCDLYIRPGYRFQVIDAMLTNFHLPRSSLLILVSAFAGRERILEAYREAIDSGYRFYSYGDAMLII